MTREMNKRQILAFIFAVLLTIFDQRKACAMSDTPSINLGGSGDGFGITRVGGHTYGSNSLGIWLSGSIRLGLSDTIDLDYFNGVGIVDGKLSRDDLHEAQEIHRQLCAAAQQGPVHEVPINEPATTYDVDCAVGGKTVNLEGKTYELPNSLFLTVENFYRKMRSKYAQEGYPIVKLDARVERLERKNNQLLVAVKFINSARFPVEIPRPDRWDARTGDRLDIVGTNTSTKVRWTVGLVDLALVSKFDTSKDAVIVPSGGSVVFEYLASPDRKLTAGAYNFNLTIFTSVYAENIAPSLANVDFHSDYENPTKITLDRDYPSTPEEWKDYESRKAKTVSPVPPGASITESGYYRAASGFGTSALLKSLKADEQAPDAPADIQFAKWHWVADLARAVTCAPGEACPRDGRWLLSSRGRYYGNPDQTYPQHERHMRAGEVSPLVSVAHVNDRDLYWTWQGA
jgi:hypothetical protein